MLFLMENTEQNPTKKILYDIQKELKRLNAIECDTLARLEAALNIEHIDLKKNLHAGEKIHK